MLSAACVLAAVGLALVSPAPAVARQVEAVVAAPALPSRERTRLNARVFDRVWREVRRGYYDPGLHGVDWRAARDELRPRALAAPDEAALYRVLGEMLARLDDAHAMAISPRALERQRQAGVSRPVMGVSLTAEAEGGWRIERVRPGSPAEAAGLEPGWRLDSIDGRPWSLEHELVDGRAVLVGATDREGTPHEAVVTPRVMPPQPPFTVDRTRPGLLVLRIEGFQGGLGTWAGEQLAALPPETDVILDLRGNPGGQVYETDALLSCFLPRDSAWGRRTARSGRVHVFRVYAGCGPLAAPIVNDLAVLVDGDSRSAAELTPAALQEAGRAVVVGRPTAGAVLIAQDTTLPDGGRLSLSRADFTTFSGVRLETRGVTPDLIAETSMADRRAGRDPALEAAAALLAGGADGRAETSTLTDAF